MGGWVGRARKRGRVEEEPKGGKDREDATVRAREDARAVRAKKDGQSTAPSRTEAKPSADKVAVTKKDKDDGKDDSRYSTKDDKGDDGKDASRKDDKRDVKKVWLALCSVKSVGVGQISGAAAVCALFLSVGSLSFVSSLCLPCLCMPVVPARLLGPELQLLLSAPAPPPVRPLTRWDGLCGRDLAG